MCQKYGSPLRLWLGPKMYLLLDNADDIETVLKSPHCLNKESVYHYVQESLSVNGLFTLEGKIISSSLKYKFLICFFLMEF